MGTKILEESSSEQVDLYHRSKMKPRCYSLNINVFAKTSSCVFFDFFFFLKYWNTVFIWLEQISYMFSYDRFIVSSVNYKCGCTGCKFCPIRYTSWKSKSMLWFRGLKFEVVFCIYCFRNQQATNILRGL